MCGGGGCGKIRCARRVLSYHLIGCLDQIDLLSECVGGVFRILTGIIRGGGGLTGNIDKKGGGETL